MKIRNALACLAMSIGTLIALPGASSASLIPSASTVYEAHVIRYTNIHRVAHLRVKLSTNSCVDSYAESHARWMASRKELKHQSMTPILSNCGLRSVGENIAVGFPSGFSTVSAWMKSSGHRANILKSSYRLIGVGAYQDTSGRWWVSQVFGTKK